MVDLELKSALAGTFGQLFDTPVVEITATVEHHGGYSGFERALCNHFADLTRGSFVTAVFRKLITIG